MKEITDDKFDPRWKETPDLPGEIYDEPADLVFVCAYCGNLIDIWEEPLHTTEEGKYFHTQCYQKSRKQ
jgi:hypothetical protein